MSFGHFKAEASIKACNTLVEMKREYKNYTTYHNHFSYQSKLKKMTLSNTEVI
ncbi:IS3 family transposase [Peribacillus saganii]|uniref:IS3 family transposase n=1 Tax=Peribacillus saganii TaxID=2303992 RepID=UPI002D7987BB|nr:IS3 family transposase [Peribacillus saganii]